MNDIWHTKVPPVTQEEMGAAEILMGNRDEILKALRDPNRKPNPEMEKLMAHFRDIKPTPQSRSFVVY